MNKRLLRKLLSENNSKSPDIYSASIVTNDRIQACSLAEEYFRIVGGDFPFISYDNWTRSLSLSVDLYFPFKHKRHLMQFIKNIRKNFPETKIIF